MGLFDKLSAEFIDIIEWTDASTQTMVWRFPRYQNEIKNGAKLTVRESQVAVFVNEGQIADVFTPGMHTLDTQNLPILSTLRGWKYGFNSPFKAEVYFVNTKQFTDLKWGTKNPIMLRDPEFGPVRLRAFGTYMIRVADPKAFVKEIVGTNAHFTTEEIAEQIRDMIVSRFADALGEAKIPALDLAANYNEMGELLRGTIAKDLGTLGLELTKLLVENISLPEDVEKALDKRTSMGVIGNLQQYTQFQAANAMEAAARNPGGDASAGIGMGMGFAMAQQMGQALAGNTAPAANQPAPPPLPGQSAEWFVAIDGKQNGPHSLAALQALVSQGLVNRQSLGWKNGMPTWSALESIPELAALLPAVPPPLP